jgi:hypothetical protein
MAGMGVFMATVDGKLVLAGSGSAGPGKLGQRGGGDDGRGTREKLSAREHFSHD